MIGRYTLHTTLNIRDPQDPKVQEILTEIRDRFKECVVGTANSLVVIRFIGEIDITSVSRLYNLVDRLGDYAVYGALVDTSYCGIPNALRVIGPNITEIATTRNMMAAKIMSFEKARVQRCARLPSSNA